jgi:hypothetical protein
MFKKIICKRDYIIFIYENWSKIEKQVSTFSYIREKNKLVFFLNRKYNSLSLKDTIIKVSWNKYYNWEKSKMKE